MKEPSIVDKNRLGELSSAETRRVIFGTERRVILTRSPTLHKKQVIGFAHTLSKAQAKLANLADALKRGKTRRTTAALAEHIASDTHESRLTLVLVCELNGTTPATHRLSVSINEKATVRTRRRGLREKTLVTTHENWPVIEEAEVADVYRSQSDAEIWLRKFKDPTWFPSRQMNHAN